MVSEEGWSLSHLWRGNVFQAQTQKSSKAWQVRSTGGCQCPGAAVTKHRPGRLGGLNIDPLSLEASSSRSRCQQGWMPWGL